MIIDTSQNSALYEGSMCFDDVVPGTQFVIYHSNLGTALGEFLCWRDELVNTFTSRPFVDSANALQAHAGSSGFVSLGEAGITAYLRNGAFNSNTFSVKVDETHMVEFHAWLKERGDHKSASRLEREFPEWLTARAPRNPYLPDFAATLDDIEDGVELFAIDSWAMPRVRNFTVEELNKNTGHFRYVGPIRGINYPSTLWQFGIMPTLDATWDTRLMTIVNTPENRRLLLAWLLGKQYDAAVKSLINLYRDLVKVEVAVADGKLTATVSPA